MAGVTDVFLILIASIPRFIVFMFGIVIWLYILPNSWTKTYTAEDKFKYASIVGAIFAVMFTVMENKKLLFS